MSRDTSLEESDVYAGDKACSNIKCVLFVSALNSTCNFWQPLLQYSNCFNCWRYWALFPWISIVIARLQLMQRVRNADITSLHSEVCQTRICNLKLKYSVQSWVSIVTCPLRSRRQLLLFSTCCQNFDWLDACLAVTIVLLFNIWTNI
jgi:hypothetical protein